MKLHAYNDYAQLKKALLCRPDNFRVIDPYHQPADRLLAISQYEDFVSILIDKGINVEFLSLMDSPAQVFTRDLGFVVGNLLIISNMSEPIRTQEPARLEEIAVKAGWDTYIMENHLEGGDVILHDGKLFIGQSDRTSKYAIQEVQSVLSQKNQDIEVVPVLITLSKIHLDCVFNVLDKDTCLLTPEVLNPEAITKVFPRILRASAADTEVLAVNIVNLGEGQILCSNATITQELINHEYDATYIEFSEFIKASGSLGCCLLPLERG